MRESRRRLRRAARRPATAPAPPPPRRAQRPRCDRENAPPPRARRPPPDGCGRRPMRLRIRRVVGTSRPAGLEALADLVFLKIAADEHDAALPRLALAPGALVVAVEHHVHALEHEALRVVLEGQNPLGAKDIGTFIGD